MGIAVITIYCNESFRIPKWKEYYNEYADEVDLHIIVDNASSDEELKKVKEAFPNSKIISLSENGGVTAAYNAGISFAKANPEIDSVAFIGNDIKLEKGGLKKLHDFLYSDERFGEVAPVLLKKDSNIIEDNGDWFNRYLMMKEYDLNKEFTSQIKSHVCDGLPGAMNIGKIKMYMDIGDLDETLFMYSDEVDIGIRAKRGGYKMSSYTGVKAWHQHVNRNNKKNRHPFSNYLVVRNKVYLARKYYGKEKEIYVFLYYFFINSLRWIKALLLGNREKMKASWWSILGACYGLAGNMKPNRFSKP